MNAERLVEFYERVADAPDAIARLRRFVLDLAVRGKLVPQDRTDEPASELLKRIAAEKARLARSGQIRKGKAHSLKMASPPHMVPRSWAWTALGDTFIYDAGVKREPKTLNPSLWLLELEDVEKDTGRLLVRVNASERASQSTKSEFCVGDVLYGKLRPYLNKVLVAGEPGYSTTEIVAIRPYIPLCARYCALALRRPDFVDYVTRLGQGTKMPRLRTEDAVVSSFPLPPLAEQHRIVAKVDELMALCNQLEAARAGRETARDRVAATNLARLNAPDPDPVAFGADARFALDNFTALTTRPEQVAQLRQTILNLAVRGRLVPQDTSDEPAAELLDRLTAEGQSYAEENRVSPAKPEAISADEVPYPVPSGWEWSRLCSLFNMITDGDHQPPPKSNKGIAFLTIGNVTTGKLNFADCRFVSLDYFSSLARYRTPRKGDILYTVVGATYGRPALVETDQDFCVQRHIAILKPASEMSLRFLVRLLSSSLVYDQATRSTTGSAQPTIPLRPLRNFLVPVPPLGEQHRIVAKVEELMALCDRLEAALTSGDNARRRLLDALLAEALASPEDATPAEPARVAACG